MSTILITDLDNTLYDFAAFFSPSLRAMVHVLSRRTGVPESQLIDEFRSVYASQGSIEYRFAVQSLPSLANTQGDQLRDLIYLANLAFSRSRRKRLKLYDGVHNALKFLQEHDVAIAIFTNAPLYLAYRRVRDLGLLPFLSHLACWEGHPIPPTMSELRDRHDRALRHLQTRSIAVSTVAEAEIKPSNKMLLNVLQAFPHISACDCYVLGDSIKKDLIPAASLNLRTIWARYGTHVNAADYKTMLDVTPEQNKTIYETEIGLDFCPDFIVDSALELKNIVPKGVQLSLF